MKETCGWKLLLNDPKSTSGQDMRKRKLDCKPCNGTNEKCPKFAVFKK